MPADDPLLNDPVKQLDKSDVASGTDGAVHALLHEVIPRLNAVIDRQKRLHERLLAVEAEVYDGEPRDKDTNPLVDAPPLDEVVSESVYGTLTDAGFEGAADIVQADDEAITALDGIGPATLESLREHYPKQQ